MMTNDRPSATIYQFPVGGRDTLRKRDERSTGDSLAPVGAGEAANGSAWYHDEAVDAENRRKK